MTTESGEGGDEWPVPRSTYPVLGLNYQLPSVMSSQGGGTCPYMAIRKNTTHSTKR